MYFTLFIYLFRIFLSRFFQSTTTQRSSQLQHWYRVGVNSHARRPSHPNARLTNATWWMKGRVNVWEEGGNRSWVRADLLLFMPERYHYSSIGSILANTSVILSNRRKVLDILKLLKTATCSLSPCHQIGRLNTLLGGHRIVEYSVKLTWSSPSHQPVSVFFRTWISWPGCRDSCSDPVAS